MTFALAIRNWNANPEHSTTLRKLQAMTEQTANQRYGEVHAFIENGSPEGH